MTARRKWLACVGAFAVGGLAASAPVFVERPAPDRPLPPPAAQRYSWIESLPESAGGTDMLSTAAPVARRGTGRNLLASRWTAPNGAMQVCFQLGVEGGGGCEQLDRSVSIQLVGRDHRSGRTSWWGILSDEGRAVRVRYADGSGRRLAGRRAFVLVRRAGPAPLSFSALGRHGAVLGTVRADAPVPVECDGSSCTIVFRYEGS